jgi:hypothetical protein
MSSDGRIVPLRSTRRIPRAPSDEARQRFVALSVAITGYDDAVLWGTGMVESYLAFLIGAIGDQVTGQLLLAWSRVVDAAGGDFQMLERLMRDEIFADATLGPVARNLIILWYLGEWQQLPADWRDVHGAHVGDQTCFVSPDAYTQGLVWRAIGAHPQGAKMPGYGSWALPPQTPEEIA